LQNVKEQAQTIKQTNTNKQTNKQQQHKQQENNKQVTFENSIKNKKNKTCRTRIGKKKTRTILSDSET